MKRILKILLFVHMLDTCHKPNMPCFFAKYYVTKSLQIQPRNTNFDRCALLAEINASNFPSRFQKGSTKTASSIHLQPTQKLFQFSRLPSLTPMLYLLQNSNDIFLVYCFTYNFRVFEE